MMDSPNMKNTDDDNEQSSSPCKKSTTTSCNVVMRKRLMSYFREYCDYSGIHGFKYIGEDRTLFERIWWIVSLLLSILLCSMMIFEIFEKYVNYPVLVTFSMQETRLQKIPFPAVTICPRAKISQEYLNLTNFFHRKYFKLEIFDEEERNVNLASTICDFYASDRNNNNTKDKEFYDFLLKSRPSIWQYCQNLGEEVNCTDIFTPILTEEGICYTYNILDKLDIFREDTEFVFPDFHNAPPISHWNIDQGYTAKIVETYPKRALRTGIKSSLLIILKTNFADVEYECPSDEAGFRVSVHSPVNIPDVAENHFTVPLGHRVVGTIIPHVIITSDGVKMFDVSKRDCYFQSEKYLRFFKIYSQDNCMIECKTNYTLKECGCVGFHMPKTVGIPICLMDNIICMEKAEYRFALFNEYSEVMEKDQNTNNITICDCRPACNEVSYSLEMSQNIVKYYPVNLTQRREMNLEKYQYSILNLRFSKNHVETKERNELYGFSDVISNFGGLLGLFTGFSILSFMEILYFLSLRLWGNFRLYGNWSGERNIE